MRVKTPAFAIAATVFVAAIFVWISDAKGGTNTLRVMTFNIHHAEGQDGRVDIERIAGVITNEQADLVGLQEVDRGTTRVSGRNLPAELAQLTGMTCVFSNNLSYQGGEYGNAILSRFPVKVRDHRLLRRVGNSEQRGWLKVEVDVAGTPLSFWNTHIDHRPDDSERMLAVEDFANWLQEETVPVILCGDFNDTPGSRVHATMKQSWIDAWEGSGTGNGYTIPVVNPTARIDYIWISKGAPIELVRSWVPNTQASDHLPVVLELKLTNTVEVIDRFHFGFDERSGANVADPGSGLMGSFITEFANAWTNDAPSARKNDSALRFDGTTRIVVPDRTAAIRTNSTNGDYTLEAWVKLAPNFIPATRMILFQYEGDPGFSFSITTGRTLHTTTFRKSDIVSSAMLPNDGDWHHIAAVHHDKSRFEFFIDGALSATSPYTDGPGFRTNPVITIGSADNQVNAFHGLLDRVRFTNRALSASQFDFPRFPGPLPPEVSLSRTTNGYFLSWPSAISNFTIETSSKVTNTTWTQIPHFQQGNENRAAVAPNGSEAYFRLRKQAD